MASIRKRAWLVDGVRRFAWVVDYVDNAGKRRNRQFATKKEAEAWRVQAIWQVSKGIHTPAGTSITVGDAADLWLAKSRRESLEPLTIEGYEALVRLHINPALGGHKLSSLTQPSIENAIDRMLESKPRATVKKVLSAIAAILKEAKRLGHVGDNVASGIRLRRQLRHKRRVIIPSKAELRRMIEQAREIGLMEYAIYMLLIFSGLRASELRGLIWSNIDFQKGTVTITQRADRKRRIGEPKSSAARRTIPLASEVLSSLTTWRVAAPASSFDLVFPTSAGTVWDYKNLMNRHFNRVQVLAGILNPVRDATGSCIFDHKGNQVWEARYGMHAMRHAAASLWIEQRVNAKRIQVWLGHSSIQLTFDTYGHLFEQAEGDATVASAIVRDVLQLDDPSRDVNPIATGDGNAE